ncbi:hypothetical protein BDP27DRAFT_1367968 [Rhodocollybia butyracea]|uniref:Uncharacterized protein n=1 Tax=Rhodocollybia butyracea TaxID=206335 RepID=A0A9P5PHQ3_9AGAR|nr:hypothetical protein BDP27DRAFT_1367968 [Rhodocollybia butyracea]
MFASFILTFSPLPVLTLDNENRYYSLISVVVNNYALFGTTLTTSNQSLMVFGAQGCLRFYHWQGWTGLIACVIAETILQMRLYALYFLNKKILCFMVGMFILATGSAAAIMVIALNHLQAQAHLGPGLPCVPLQIPSYFYTFWIPILAFETLLCILALNRGFQSHRDNGAPFQSGKRIIGVLIRDSVVYYIVMFATYLTCLLVWLVNNSLLEVPIGFTIAFSCVLGNRVILNVRKINEELKEEAEEREDRFTRSSRKGNSSRTMTTTQMPEPESDTLTDFEMAQLRTMKAESFENMGPVVV